MTTEPALFDVDDQAVEVTPSQMPPEAGDERPKQPRSLAFLVQEDPGTGNRGWEVWIQEWRWDPKDETWAWGRHQDPRTRITRAGLRPPRHELRVEALARLGFELVNPGDPDTTWDWAEADVHGHLYFRGTAEVRRIGAERNEA